MCNKKENLGSPETGADDDSSAKLEEKGVKEDDDGKKYIEVQSWNDKTGPKDDMKPNNCIERIAMNYKPEGMSLSEAMKLLMEANSKIYDSKRGTSGGSGKLNTTLYTNEKFIIPDEWLK